MIDYLEELLEEEAAADLEGKPLTVVGRRREARPTGEETAGQEDDPDRLAAGVQPAEQEARLLAEMEAAEQAVRLPEETETALVGESAWAAAEGQRAGAAGLVWQLRHTSRAARLAAPGQTGVTVTFPGEGSAPSKPDLLALDRAVQRDARRYDGGFPLY